MLQFVCVGNTWRYQRILGACFHENHKITKLHVFVHTYFYNLTFYLWFLWRLWKGDHIESLCVTRFGSLPKNLFAANCIFEQPSQLVFEIPDARNRKGLRVKMVSVMIRKNGEMVFGGSSVCNICVTNTFVTACPPTWSCPSPIFQIQQKCEKLFLISLLPYILRMQLFCCGCAVKWQMFNNKHTLRIPVHRQVKVSAVCMCTCAIQMLIQSCDNGIIHFKRASI